MINTTMSQFVADATELLDPFADKILVDYRDVDNDILEVLAEQFPTARPGDHVWTFDADGNTMNAIIRSVDPNQNTIRLWTDWDTWIRADRLTT